MNERKAREIVNIRSERRCEIAIPTLCTGHATNMHHRRKPGRVWTPSNLLAACGSGTTGCHGYVEAEPLWGKRLGLWLLDSDDPAITPVYMRWADNRSWYRLNEEGMVFWIGPDFEDLDLAQPGASGSQQHHKPPR